MNKSPGVSPSTACITVLHALACLIFVTLFSAVVSPALASDNNLINDLSAKLKNRKTVAVAIDEIVASDAPAKREWLEALLAGNLYQRKSDKQVVYASKSENGFTLTSASDGSALGEVGKRKVSKFKINNSLRGKLRSAIAQMALQDSDPASRRDALARMMLSLDESKMAAIDELAKVETDASVLSLIDSAKSLNALQNGSTDEKLAAIDSIGIDTSDTVVQSLRSLSGDADDAVATAASDALIKIEQRISLFKHVETLLFGLSLGSVLAMAAIGLAITFGVMGVINMAHGEMIMLGAYTTWAVQQVLPSMVEYSLLLAIPSAFIVAFLVGVVIEYLVIRHLYGRPLETLLATFGISLILQQTVRTLVSPQNVPVSNPSWLSGQWQIDPALSVAVNRVVIFFFCLAVFLALMWLLRRTFFGLKVRAVSQNRDMAKAMGARSSRIDAMTFGLGAGIAGVAGVALSQLTNVGPNMGQSYIVDSFMVVVFGGVGNLWGTLLAGLSLGVVNKFLEPWVGAVLAKIVVLVFIILFIQRYPRGLFPQRGRAVGD
jgi:urea transport system permease protein